MTTRNRATKHGDEKPADWWPPTADYAAGVIRNRVLEADAERIRARELHISGRVLEAEECERAAVRHAEYAAEVQARFWPTTAGIADLAGGERVVGISVGKRGRT